MGRSPFPTIHILRNAEIELVTKNKTDGESISLKNEAKLKSMNEFELKIKNVLSLKNG